ncbi:glycosyltransferase family 1 protein [Chlorobium sp. BLA1]|uniref:glycosyltransferase family 4 protein n=1 Tax=Candidatus Chlorobium masyuteum TaxID=2716876 RepID=UPI00141EB02F|nr:glycosyltransferase family 1 protein [Candidatus Chlorobium masyuteum]NHQ59966.1 glycosyltransferase family 1 protein [Candidatus Chlorobium masyuteum]NTU44811.1 glycosyltransferase family 1 protein [Chlorobiaceae bacterium]
MKIALYSGTYVKDKDGAVKSIYQLVASFRKNGHELTVWSPDVSSRDNHNGLTVHKMPAVPLPLYPDYKIGFFNAETMRQLDEFAPDIVHISTPDIIGRAFLLYARKRSLPVASAFHTDFPSYLSYYHLGFAEKYAWKYLTWFYNNCDVVLAPNESVRRKLLDKNINNVEIWSRGIDRELFDPLRRSEKLREAWDASGKSVIVYAGRFVLYKDIEVVMRVYDRFMESGFARSVKFVLIGSGPAEEEMRERMPDAIFTGYLTGVALPEAYASGDIFFFPSTTEAFCNVALEALASGLPAVVSDGGGCRNIIDRSGGGVVARAGDVEDFFTKCRELHEHSGRYSELRSLGLAYAEAQSWSTVNGVVIDHYSKLVMQSTAPAGL